jgi:hypothetical protein
MCTCTSAQKAEVARQAVLDLRHVIPREIIHKLTDDVRGVNRADLIDQDPGIPARNDDPRPEDGRLGAGRGRDDGHRRLGALLDADDQPETPPPLLMAALGIAEVYRVDGAADHAHGRSGSWRPGATATAGMQRRGRGRDHDVPVIPYEGMVNRAETHDSRPAWGNISPIGKAASRDPPIHGTALEGSSVMAAAA